MIVLTIGEAVLEYFSTATDHDEVRNEMLRLFGTFLVSGCAETETRSELTNYAYGTSTLTFTIAGTVQGTSYTIVWTYTR